MRHILIVTASQKDAANVIAASSFDRVGGINTFTNGINATGLVSDPATHYWACPPPMAPAMVEAIMQFQVIFPGSIVAEWDDENLPNFPSQLLQANGLKVIVRPN